MMPKTMEALEPGTGRRLISSLLATDGAKLFASAYAIFSGLVFISVMGIILAPVVHRVIHRFHLDD